MSQFIPKAKKNIARIVIENRLRRKQKDFESVRDFLEELQIAKKEPEKEKELNKNSTFGVLRFLKHYFKSEKLICSIYVILIKISCFYNIL